MQKFCLFIISCFISAMAMAVVATPELITVKQKNGKDLQVYLRGDENFNWYETANGQLLTKNAQGDLQPATALEAENIRQTRAQKLQIARIAQQTNVSTNCPKTGTVRIPVLLIAFKNLGFSINNPKQEFSDFFNAEHYTANGSTSSVSGYYTASSNGALKLIFDVFGPFTMEENYEYYGANTKTNSFQHINDMIINAVTQAALLGVDFSKYDANSDGKVDNISIVFAGHNEAEGGGENTIWPHRSSVYSQYSFNDKKLDSYLVISELRGSSGKNQARIGTYCHEFGHVLGLPDLYNTNSNAAGAEQIYTVGNWDLMSSGNYNNEGRTPPLVSAFERYMLGWLKPEQITEAGNYKLPPLSTSNRAYLIAATKHNVDQPAADGDEFFLIENRQRIGLESNISCLPGIGMLISHITFSQKKWNTNTFNDIDSDSIICYDIVEAYNKKPTVASASDSYPGSMQITSMMPTLNSGDQLTKYEISNIFSWDNGIVTFTLGKNEKNGITFAPTAPDVFITIYDGKTIDYKPQTLLINANGITSDSIRVKLTNNNFELYIDNEWQTTGTTFPVNEDGTLKESIDIRFVPRRQSCTETSSLLKVFDIDTLCSSFCTLLGKAPRPTYITAPANVIISENTISSFRVQWEEQEDAELYYINVYEYSSDNNEPIVSKEIVAPEDHTYITALKESHSYRVELMAYENKGCEEHFSAPTIVNTRTSGKPDFKTGLTVIQHEDGTCTIKIPDVQDESLNVYIYTTDGRLLTQSKIPLGEMELTFSSNLFRKNELYLVKCTPLSKYKRKAFWAKFIYNGIQ